MKNTIIDDVYILQFTKLMTIVNNTVNVINRRHTIIIINFFCFVFMCHEIFIGPNYRLEDYQKACVVISRIV